MQPRLPLLRRKCSGMAKIATVTDELIQRNTATFAEDINMMARLDYVEIITDILRFRSLSQLTG